MPTYQCPKGCFSDSPFKCDHGGSQARAVAAKSAPLPRLMIPRELAAKLLGLRSQPAPSQNLWVRDRAPVEAVKQRYRDDAEKAAAARVASRGKLCPLGPAVVDEHGIMVPAAEYWARNP